MGALSANVTYPHDGDWLAGQALITPKSTVASTSLSAGDASVERSGGRSGTRWGAQVCPGANSMEVALQAIRTILVDSTEPSDMTCVARSGNVEIWRVDFGNDTSLEWKEGLV